MKKIYLALISVFIIGIVASGAFASSGFQNNTMSNHNKWGYSNSNENRENCVNHDDIESAIESHNYEAWKELMSDNSNSRMLDIVNQDNFETFVKMHNARENNDFETFDNLRTKLGISSRSGNHNGGCRHNN